MKYAGRAVSVVVVAAFLYACFTVHVSTSDSAPFGGGEHPVLGVFLLMILVATAAFFGAALVLFWCVASWVVSDDE